MSTEVSAERAANEVKCRSPGDVSAEWAHWIVLNVGRGVPPAALVGEMVKNNFDHEFAAAVVSRYSAGGAANLPACSPLISANRSKIADHTIEIALRITAPTVVVLEHALSPQECDELIALSRPKLSRSTIVDRRTGDHEVIEARSSEGTYFERGENELVSRIEARLSEWTGVPVDNGEGLQILRYGPGAEYRPHYDFFVPEDPGSTIHLQKGGQRTSTTIMYLNDVDAGGETVFPDIRLSVSPRKGAAVHFSYCDSAGTLDRLTLHGGAPVKRGEKWIATKWLRQGAYV